METAAKRKHFKRLTFFSRHRQRIIGYFQDVKVSSDMKILFVEQHSMKLGDRTFYHIEGER